MELKKFVTFFIILMIVFTIVDLLSQTEIMWFTNILISALFSLFSSRN